MSQESRKNIAINVKKYREQKGLKREELSLLLEVDNSYISKLERQNVNITIDKLDKIAEILDIKTIKLFEEQK